MLRPAPLLPSLSTAFDAPLWPATSLPSAGACYQALRRLPGRVLHPLEERVFQDAPSKQYTGSEPTSERRVPAPSFTLHPRAQGWRPCPPTLVRPLKAHIRQQGLADSPREPHWGRPKFAVWTDRQNVEWRVVCLTGRPAWMQIDPPRQLMMKAKSVNGFDHTTNWMAEVRKASILGSQIVFNNLQIAYLLFSSPRRRRECA